MTSSRILTWLTATVAVLAVLAAAIGLVSESGAAPSTVTSIRGDAVQLYGHGLYRFDTLLTGPGSGASTSSCW
jgi:hypothetical protein